MLMQPTAVIVIFEIFLIATANPIEENNVQKLQSDSNKREYIIDKLENEKNELYLQISQAIRETVKTLQKNNDTETLLELQKIKDIKNHFKEMNGTDQEVNLEDTGELEPQMNNSEVRRAFQIKKDKLEDGMRELVKLMKKLDVTKENKTIDPILQKQLDDWIAAKESSKQKKKEYGEKNKKLKYEKCPRYGVIGKHRKKKYKTDVKYPCCRKCCKSSYMGCL